MSRLRFLLPVALLGSPNLAACSDSEVGRTTSAILGEQGGKLAIAGATLEIPPGALAYDLRIELSRLQARSTTPPYGVELAGPAFACRPHGTQFDEPVTLELPYTAESGDFLTIMRLDTELDKTWSMSVAATFDAGLARLQVDGFSVYAVGRSKQDWFGVAGEGGAPSEFDEAEFCQRSCAARADLGCEHDRAAEYCIADCVAASDDTTACHDERLAHRMCLFDDLNRAYECASDGKSKISNDLCEDKQADLLVCMGLY